MKRLLIAMVAALACAAIAEGQGMPPGKWWQRPELVRELQLSNEQRDRLDTIFRGAANELIDAKGEVEKLQIAIRGELDRPQVRRAELQRIAGQLSAARGKLFQRELMMLVDMRGVLTEQQWARMRKHLDRGGPPRRRRQ
ncbi:MAG TPA: periplasmic heavy metal sensor [Thermoanaerobaculia bacterium]